MSVQNDVKVWASQFAKAARKAAGESKVLTPKKAAKMEEPYADNAKSYFERTGKKRVDVETLVGSERLQSQIAAIAPNVTLVSESDSHPVFMVSDAAFPADKALTGDAVFKAFSPLVKTHFANLLDGEPAAKAYSKAELKKFWTNSTTQLDENSYGNGSTADGWKALKVCLEANLKDVTMVKVGPKGELGELQQDAGSYLYCLVGRTPNGRLAGVYFQAAET